MSTGRVPFPPSSGAIWAAARRRCSITSSAITLVSASRRWVNDFGTINIDAELIERQEGNTIGLAGWPYLSCSLAAGFFVALKPSYNRTRCPIAPSWRQSGVADPGKIAQYDESPSFALDGVIVGRRRNRAGQAGDKYVGRDRRGSFASADLLVLNKIDLIAPERKREVAAWLARVAPQSRPDRGPLRIGAAGVPLSGPRWRPHAVDIWRQMATTTTMTPATLRGPMSALAPTTREAFEEYVRQFRRTRSSEQGFCLPLLLRPDRQQIFAACRSTLDIEARCALAGRATHDPDRVHRSNTNQSGLRVRNPKTMSQSNSPTTGHRRA